MTGAHNSSTDPVSEPTSLKPIVVFFDGAGCRPDGKGSGLAWLRQDTGEKHVQRIDGLTNNEAEYRAFVAVLESLPEGSKAELFSDSLLLDSQFHGKYRVKDSDLAGLLGTAHELIRHKKLTVNLQWIPAAKNLAGKLL
jgi:ribonuclease HI